MCVDCRQVSPSRLPFNKLAHTHMPIVASLAPNALYCCLPPPHPPPRLLDRERDMNGGKYPETIALVLWGTDNIKTYGESLAQVRGWPVACTERDRERRGGVASASTAAGSRQTRQTSPLHTWELADLADHIVCLLLLSPYHVVCIRC